MEVAHHISSGSVDAIVADPVARFGELIAVTQDIRKRYPACLSWLFSAEGSLPPLRDCVGRGIDGRVKKDSSGFLDLPRMLLDRLRWVEELRESLPLDPGSLFSSFFPAATCLLSESGDLMMVSDEFERLVEQPRFGLIGQPFNQFWSSAEKRDAWDTELLRPPRTWDFVGHFRTSRGDKPLMAMSLRQISIETHGKKLWAASLSDISGLELPHQTQRPTAKVQGNTEAEQDQIAFTLSHDLQAPLNSITSYAKFLQEDIEAQSPETQEAIIEIGSLSARMQDMLDGILEYSLLESQNEQLEIISLDGVLDEAIANLRSDIDNSGATIEHQPLPALAVMRHQMIQVFQNIISNAIKFRGSRIPRIRISAVETGEYLRIKFEDNGIGLDSEEKQQIFEMFHRSESGKNYPGVGAGLAICQRIVRAHGGEISVESTPGRGSSFILEFRGASVRRLGTANGAVG